MATQRYTVTPRYHSDAPTWIKEGDPASFRVGDDQGSQPAGFPLPGLSGRLLDRVEESYRKAQGWPPKAILLDGPRRLTALMAAPLGRPFAFASPFTRRGALRSHQPAISTTRSYDDVPRKPHRRSRRCTRVRLRIPDNVRLDFCRTWSVIGHGRSFLSPHLANLGAPRKRVAPTRLVCISSIAIMMTLSQRRALQDEASPLPTLLAIS
jgi:hypothetical protein